SVMIPPMYHPVRLAEETALLDMLSGGRVILGAGLGGTRFRDDYSAYGMEGKGRVGRLKEQMEIIRQLWRGETVSHHGEFYTLEGAKLAFTPTQSGGPPVWIGGRTDTGARLAATVGDGFLPGPSIPISGLRRFYNIYESLVETGVEPKVRPLMREATINPTDEESKRDDQLVTEYFIKSYLKASSVKELHDPDLSKLAENTFIRGGPEECVRRTELYAREFNVDHLILRFRFSSMSDEKVHMKMRLFAEKVFPSFR
ncbi:MAG: LLM class flavin-dependent oxidoreductase, partial [Thaumarchaeota archaeon]|nr:LLM class flavin-dependent oxidoreductase [Nitrososphaerota archaeon]